MAPCKLNRLPVPRTLLCQQQSVFPSGAAHAPHSQANLVVFTSVALSLYLLGAPWSMIAYGFLLCSICSVVFWKACGSPP